MTDETDSPSLPATPVETQVNLRDDLLAKLDKAQADIESQLLILRQAANSDPANEALLSSQLAMLTVLRHSVDGASPATLAQLQQAVAVASAAASASVEQVRSGNATALASGAAYQAATADLDRRVAATFAADAANNDLAHSVADRQGIDLSAFDHERQDLEAQRQDAIARGDKVAERQADLLIAQNTKNAMTAGLDGITDPEEHARYQQQIDQQQRIIEERRAAYERQLELDGARRAEQMHLPPDQAARFLATYKAEGLEKADARVADLTPPDQAAQTKLFETFREARAAVTGDELISGQSLPAVVSSEAANDKSAVTAFNDANAASTFQFDLSGLSPSIALSAAPDAHTSVEVPAVKRDLAITSGQALV